MLRIPFSVYDFFGYLSTGFLSLLTIFYIRYGRIPTSNENNVLNWILLIILAYIVGHINAALSKWVLERWLLDKLFGDPDKTLFGITKGAGKKRAKNKSNETLLEKTEASEVKKAESVPIFEHMKPLPNEIIDKIKIRSDIDKIPNNGYGLFSYAYSKVKKEPEALGRVDIFQSLYGFCRNMSFTLILISALFLFAHFSTNYFGSLELSIICILASIILALQFMKFRWYYKREIYLTYIHTSIWG